MASFLRPQDSFPKELWIEYALALEKENKILKGYIIVKTCEKIYWSLFKSGSKEEKSTPIQYIVEASKQLSQDLPDFFEEKKEI